MTGRDLDIKLMLDTVTKFSTDIHTKIGAVILSRSGRLISYGYNGFPQKVKTTPERALRPTKYNYFIHAEQRAIARAAKEGRSLKGAALYCNYMPCHNCALSIIESGMSKVYCGKEPNDRWIESCKISREMFLEAGVGVYPLPFLL